MDDRWLGAGMARRVVVGVFALIACLCSMSAVASAAEPFVRIEGVNLTRDADGATLEADIVWNAEGAASRNMEVGEVHALAISADDHIPTRLGSRRFMPVSGALRQHVAFPITARGDLEAIRRGNRVTITATQHREVVGELLSPRSYLTVATAQSFTTPQDRIGRESCADTPIELGAVLHGCDLVGADLDGALVSRRLQSTRMELADLTGATLRDADVTGATVAGGRLNGADISGATIDNLSLAAAQGVELKARDVKSDIAHAQGAGGANIFHADMRRADFSGARLNNVSIARSDFDGASFEGAQWGQDGRIGDALLADGTSLRGANLKDVTAFDPALYFADLTGADLSGMTGTEGTLTYATECRTTLPDRTRSDRDCPIADDDGPDPVLDPHLTVAGRLTRDKAGVRITGTVAWGSDHEIGFLTAGHVRAVAIDADTHRATELFTIAYPRLDATATIDQTVTGAAKVAATAPGNRVVLTATQHEPIPDTGLTRHGPYVDVATLQPGPGRKRIGDVDCSDEPIQPGSPGPEGYTSCYLPGAWLERADLAGATLIKTNLAGAVLRSANLQGVKFDGAEMGSVDAQRSIAGPDMTLVESVAPAIDFSFAPVTGRLTAATLAGAVFTKTTITSTTFAGTPMPKARLDGAWFLGNSDSGVDLAYADLRAARLDVAGVAAPSSLFMADLTRARMQSKPPVVWPPDTSGTNPPWTWSTLCDTLLPTGAVADRDCPRVPNG